MNTLSSMNSHKLYIDNKIWNLIDLDMYLVYLPFYGTQLPHLSYTMAHLCGLFRYWKGTL
jgi:hypothetical protein